MTEPSDDAKRLINSHGGKAPQHIVDRITAAVRRGDDAETRRLDALLREVDRLRRGG
ncbi:hypothetical protein [Sphingomonas sp. M1-B02]|uniref:hypothetical protein n=1 Tax=Sphingomonas sp. M1-B02 TaxID=3114300 RepID=UPI002240C238|nr:hypothetical protein [Sphingomonas sp. S6-11]UZK67268.1 hypothetical protein OKW87_05395 [Sphingomonas sp. S6-11]